MDPEPDNPIPDDSVERSTFNPSVTEDLEDDLEKLKGDAIGDTLYSSRFVLSTLLKLATYEQKLSEDEAFEKDLCYLWDMTIEKDVVHLLLQHDILELIADIIRRSEDERMVEILIGLIGNMCAVQQTRDDMCNSARIMIPVLELISCSDSLVLVQLMRLLHAALVFENVGDELVWFNHFRQIEDFVDKFAFILINSTSTTLLFSAFEALNAICNKFAVIEILPGISDSSFRDIFVKPILIGGIIEAFKQMMPDEDDSEHTTDETSMPTERSQKIMSLFLDINDILSQYEMYSMQSYEPHLSEFLKCISKILSPLCQPIYLFPLTTSEQGFIETINELFQCLGDPFDVKCCAQLIRIWNEIEAFRENADVSEWEDSSADGEKVQPEDMSASILDVVMRIIKRSDIDAVQKSVKCLNMCMVTKLQKAIAAEGEGMQECCTLLQKAVDNVCSGELNGDDKIDNSDK